MFNYAFNNADVKPSNEDYAEGSALPKPEVCLTDGATRFITKCSISGLIRAFAARMYLSGIAREEVGRKLDEFVELVRRSGDITKAEADDLKKYDFLAARVPTAPVVFRDTFGMSGYAADLSDAAIGTYDWRYVPDEERKNMSDQEKSILDNYEAAARAYFEASTIRSQYYAKRAGAVISGLLTKYGEALRTMDEELLKFLQENFTTENGTTAA